VTISMSADGITVQALDEDGNPDGSTWRLPASAVSIGVDPAGDDEDGLHGTVLATGANSSAVKVLPSGTRTWTSVPATGTWTTTSTVSWGMDRDRRVDFWKARREWRERTGTLLGSAVGGGKVAEGRRSEALWGLRRAVGMQPARRAKGSGRPARTGDEMLLGAPNRARLLLDVLADCEAKRTATTCSVCGYLVDTPNHEIGCRAGNPAKAVTEIGYGNPAGSQVHVLRSEMLGQEGGQA